MALSVTRAGPVMLGPALARKCHPKGNHVVYVIVDGQIDTPKLRARDPSFGSGTVISPDAIAAAVISCLRQPHYARSQEMNLRRAVETF